MDLSRYRNSKFIFVVGIGGSDLASKAVWNAMTLHKPNVGKRVFFLESPDSREYEEVQSFVKNEVAGAEEIALIAVSKSGQTLETLEAFHKTFDILSEKFGQPIIDRTLVISTKNTPLWKIAEEKDMERLEWEEGVGGRFSAFTVAHTTVLAIAGVNIERFKEAPAAAKAMAGEEGKLAQNIFDNYKNGKNILDFFVFNSELEDLGKWCRQLIAESLGKESKDGERIGITPTVSIGPTDLHSMLQLNLGGPKNRFTIFIKSLKEIDGSVNDSAYENVTKAYEEAGLPFMKYEMAEINEKELGGFMAFMMAATVKLAKLLGVNPYDQPEVEEYKSQISNSK